MQLTDQDIETFRDVWQREFHETITSELARQRASQVLELYALLARPLPSESAEVEGTPSTLNEVLPVLQKIDRGRGPSGPVD